MFVQKAGWRQTMGRLVLAARRAVALHGGKRLHRPRDGRHGRSTLGSLRPWLMAAVPGAARSRWGQCQSCARCPACPALWQGEEEMLVDTLDLARSGRREP